MPRTYSGQAPAGVQGRGGRSFEPGDEHYLWALVLVELLVMVVLRNQFRNAHGG